MPRECPCGPMAAFRIRCGVCPMFRRSLLCAALLGVAATAVHAQTFPDPADQAGHRLPRRRPDRHHDAPAGRQRVQDPRPAGHHRQQARRRRHAARAGAADRGARRLHHRRRSRSACSACRYTTKINWDPVKDISYVINVTGYAFGIVVPADSPFKTWTDFVAYAKANPGKLTYGSTGTLTSPHLTTELIAQQPASSCSTCPTRAAPTCRRPCSAAT